MQIENQLSLDKKKQTKNQFSLNVDLVIDRNDIIKLNSLQQRFLQYTLPTDCYIAYSK